jgi:RNA polymerase sigma-70 factor (ECF subfamily)
VADLPEPSLVRRAITGDRSALELLWTSSRRLVAAVLVAHGARGQEVPDLVQEAACAFTRGIGGLRDAAAFPAWLRTTALNALRASRRRRGDAALEVEPCAPSDARSEGADEVRQVWAALAELPAELREPLVLKAVDGLSQRAVAAALGVPETTIETRLARARRALRALLARERGACLPCQP